MTNKLSYHYFACRLTSDPCIITRNCRVCKIVKDFEVLRHSKKINLRKEIETPENNIHGE